MGRETRTLRPRRRGTWLLALSSHTMCYRWSQGSGGLPKTCNSTGVSPQLHISSGNEALGHCSSFILQRCVQCPGKTVPLLLFPSAKQAPGKSFVPSTWSIHLRYTLGDGRSPGLGLGVLPAVVAPEAEPSSTVGAPACTPCSALASWGSHFGCCCSFNCSSFPLNWKLKRENSYLSSSLLYPRGPSTAPDAWWMPHIIQE